MLCTSNCEYFEHSRNLISYFTMEKLVLMFIQNQLQQVALLSLADSSVLWLWSTSNSGKELLRNTQRHSCGTSWQLLKAATPFLGTARSSSAVAAQSQENTSLVQGVANICGMCASMPTPKQLSPSNSKCYIVLYHTIVLFQNIEKNDLAMFTKILAIHIRLLWNNSFQKFSS